MGKGAQSTTQTTKVELPKWVDEAAQKNYSMAEDIAAKPFVSSIAPENDLTKLGNSFFTDDPRAGGILGMDRAAYTNPYTNDVVNAAMGDLDDSRMKSLMGNSDAALAAKAFGGSRHGVVDAVTNSETAKAAGSLSANLRSSAFDKGTDLMLKDIDVGKSMAGGALAAGASKNAFDSGVLGEANSADTEKLNLLLASLGMSPYGKTETGTATKSGAGTDWASLIFGGLQTAAAFSDRKAKTDIEKLGRDPETGIDLYAYRYKNDPKNYPKVVGPMAQDIEKMDPSAVTRIGGKLIVRGPLAA